MKKLFLIISFLFLLLPTMASAVPPEWNITDKMDPNDFTPAPPPLNNGQVNSAGEITFIFHNWNTFTATVYRQKDYQTKEEDEANIEELLKAMWRGQGAQGDIRRITHVNGVKIEDTKWKAYGGDIPVTNPYLGGRNPQGLPIKLDDGRVFCCLKSDDRISINEYLANEVQKEKNSGGSKYTPDAVTVVIDNEPVFFPDTQPVIKEARTLVPMRAAFEHFNFQAEVYWDEKSKSVTTVNREGKSVIFTIGQKEYTFIGSDGRIEKRTTDVAPTIMSGRTMLPLRAISEAFEMKVAWYNDTKVVDIKATADQKKLLMKKTDWQEYLKGVYAEYEAKK